MPSKSTIYISNTFSSIQRVVHFPRRIPEENRQRDNVPFLFTGLIQFGGVVVVGAMTQDAPEWFDLGLPLAVLCQMLEEKANSAKRQEIIR